MLPELGLWVSSWEGRESVENGKHIKVLRMRLSISRNVPRPARYILHAFPASHGPYSEKSKNPGNRKTKQNQKNTNPLYLSPYFPFKGSHRNPPKAKRTHCKRVGELLDTTLGNDPEQYQQAVKVLCDESSGFMKMVIPRPGLPLGFLSAIPASHGPYSEKSENPERNKNLTNLGNAPLSLSLFSL